MMRTEKEYIRLPGKRRKLLGHDTLWAGKDHLLSVNLIGFSEDYKRFYYRDIQAITLQKDARGKTESVVFGLFTLSTVLASLKLGDVGKILLWSFTWFFPVLFFISLVRGPTCLCHIHTAVHVEELPSLNRVRTARKALGILVPLIEGVQGKLGREELQVRAAEVFRESPAVPPSSSHPMPTAPLLHSSPGAQERIGSKYGLFHALLFCVLLLNGLVTSIGLLYNHIALTLLEMGLLPGLGVCVMIALVKQQKAPMLRLLRSITWGTLAYLCVCFLIHYVHYFIIAFQHPDIMNNQWEMVKFISALPPPDSSLLIVYLISPACSFTLGLSGLIALRLSRQEFLPLPSVSGSPAVARSVTARE